MDWAMKWVSQWVVALDNLEGKMVMLWELQLAEELGHSMVMVLGSLQVEINIISLIGLNWTRGIGENETYI